MHIHSICYHLLKQFNSYNEEVAYLACTALQNICAYSTESRAALMKSNWFIIPTIVDLINESEAASTAYRLSLMQLLYVLCNSSDIISLTGKVCY
jgi:hypothetical protein